MNAIRLAEIMAISASIQDTRKKLQATLKRCGVSNLCDPKEVKEVARYLTNADADIQRAALIVDLSANALRQKTQGAK